MGRILSVLVLVVLVSLSGFAPAAERPAARAVDFGVPCGTRGVTGTAYAQGVNCRLVDIDGYPRQYIVWVSASAASKIGRGEEVPVVFMIHGTSGDGAKFLKISGWREKADAEGFVAVFPSGLTYRVTEPGEPPVTTTKWNSFDLAPIIDATVKPPGYPGSAPWPADDVSFMRATAADLAAQLPIDPHRIFLSGFSNGGEMCGRIAVEASDLFAAVGCSAGGLDAVHPTTPGHPKIPEVLSVGTIDSHLRDRIQAIDPSYTELSLEPNEILQTPIVSDGIAFALESIGLREQPFTTVTKPTFTAIQWSTPTAGNADGNDFVFVVMAGVDHEYANAKNNPHAFVIADRYWDFFTDHPLKAEPDLTPPPAETTPPDACASDCAPPQTKIKKHPPGRTHAHSVTYKFTADDLAATFKCKLDHKDYRRCKSPDKLHVKAGKHTFKVQATDSSGNKEEKPAKDTFRVIR